MKSQPLPFSLYFQRLWAPYVPPPPTNPFLYPRGGDGEKVEASVNTSSPCRIVVEKDYEGERTRGAVWSHTLVLRSQVTQLVTVGG